VTSRSISILGIFSGSIDISFTMSLETVQHEVLTGSLFVDVPWPCADQSLSARFVRRNGSLF
jgi:hypothetical protein